MLETVENKVIIFTQKLLTQNVLGKTKKPKERTQGKAKPLESKKHRGKKRNIAPAISDVGLARGRP